MTEANTGDQQTEAPRGRLSRLREASLRINESLDFDTVLQGIIDSARSLTGARYGVITLLDESGRVVVEDFYTSGLTAEESALVRVLPGGMRFFEYVRGISEPLRVPDLLAHVRAAGLPELTPLAAGPVSFLASPMSYRAESVGLLFVTRKEEAREFTSEDEDTLIMFASQAAMVIANVRRYRDEQRAKADLEALVNMSPVGVLVFDARTGALVLFNREAGRIVESLKEPDQPPEKLLDMLTFRRADGQEFSLKEFPVAELMSAGEPVRAEEIALQVPDGRSVSALLNATPIRSEGGELESFVVTLQDMAPLQELDRQRTEFLGMVGHELRTPLTSIRGSATTLLDASDLDPAEMSQFCRIILQQADTMRELIGDLADIARIETGMLKVAPEPAEVAGLVDRARTTFLSGGGRHLLEIDLEPDLPLVMVDQRRIVQVLLNLLSNAARHSPEASAIQVTAEHEDVHVSVTVTDRGRGIPAERLPHLFRKSALADPGEGERSTGVPGLGLVICKGIVEAHGGRIQAESDGPGQGARFTFTIPAVEEAAPRGPRPPRSRRHRTRKKARVLVVDDDPETLRYVRQVLSGAEYEAVVTADGKEAVQLMKEYSAHLVLLDLVLPGTDGIEVMQDILRIAEVPVIFLSAYGSDQVIHRAFEAGADDYIVKPFSPTELVARIRAALRRREAASRPEPAGPYALGELAVDYEERRVTLAGRTVKLTAAEYDLLWQLSVHAGKLMTNDQLMRRLWGPAHNGDMRGLRSLVKRLRGKLGDDAANPTYIFNEPRVGYRMPSGEPAEPKGEPPGEAS